MLAIEILRMFSIYIVCVAALVLAGFIFIDSL